LVSVEASRNLIDAMRRDGAVRSSAAWRVPSAGKIAKIAWRFSRCSTFG
jgi:hypothetical protein